jgi:hypothetical protein
MNFIPSEIARNLIRQTNGRFFSAEVIKKKGQHRVFNARTGVKKYVAGTLGRNRNEEDEFTDNITIWDRIARNYRRINLNGVRKIKCGKILINAKKI